MASRAAATPVGPGCSQLAPWHGRRAQILFEVHSGYVSLRSSIGWNAAASACVDVWPQGLALLVPWLHTLI